MNSKEEKYNIMYLIVVGLVVIGALNWGTTAFGFN